MVPALLGVPAWAGGAAAPPDFPGLKASSFSWSSPQRALLMGVPAYWAEFTSQASFLQAAKVLAEQDGRFQRVLVSKGGLVLSGMRADWHWLAEILPAAEGSRGRISILRANAPPSGLSPKNDAGHFPWLAHHADLRFSHESMAGGRRALQEMYTAPMSIEQMTAYVQENLRRTGWRPEPKLASVSSAGSWSRKSSRLFVMAVPAEPGSAVFLNYIQ